jgi:hypothetical protein
VAEGGDVQKDISRHVGDLEDLEKEIRRRVGDGGDRQNKFRFSYRYFNNLKLE